MNGNNKNSLHDMGFLDFTGDEILDICANIPFKLKSADEIISQLEESRKCYERGEYMDFDKALYEIREKYGL